MTEEAVKMLNAINSELKVQSHVPRECPYELHDDGELVFEYRERDLFQIGYFPRRAVNDKIPVLTTHKDGRKAVVAIDVWDWHDSLFDFANFASVDWFE